MRTIKIKEYEVGLSAKFGEYNCGNKTTGRLHLNVLDKEGTDQDYYPIVKELEDSGTRNKIIENFLKDLDDRKTYKSLNCTEFFPGDTGVYPPGVLLYCDAITMDASIKWYTNWKGLIELFELEPKFGVKIFKSPILPNRYYSTRKPSRVWTIVLPSISDNVCENKVPKDMLDSLSGVSTEGSKLLKKELKALGVKL